MADNPIRSIIETAIQREIDAFNLYSSAAGKVDAQHAKNTLAELAAQEQGHRNRLESLLEGDTFALVSRTQRQKVVDLKITDYLVEVPLKADSSFQDILIVAGKREKGSFDLYTALAQVSDDQDAKKLFNFLAAEELAHKNRIESLYEDVIYAQN